MKLKLASVAGFLMRLCVIGSYSAEVSPISAAQAVGANDPARLYGRLWTIAGSGAGGTDNVNYWKASFEGGFATNAALSRPHHAIADTAGNIFIVDKNSHSVLKLTPDGRIHTFAGTHVGGFNGDGPAPATTLELKQPNGLYLNGAGEVFVLDTGNNRVRWVGSDGVMSTLFVDTNGINGGRGLWVNDQKTEAVFCSGKDLKMWTSSGGVKVLNSKFTDLGNIYADSPDTVIATDRGDSTVWEVTIHGAEAGSRTHLYGDGRKKRFVDGEPAATGSLYGVRGIWKLPAGGDLLITDEGCQMIYVDTAGIGHVWLDGRVGAHSGDGVWFDTPGAKISQGRAVSVDSRGNILIVENDRGYVRKIEYMPAEGGSSESTAFTPGNLAVLRVGDGTETLARTGNSIFVDQYLPGGTFANSIALPNTGGGALVLSGTAASEGGLTRTLDRTALVLSGYNTEPGSIGTAGSVPRALATVNAFGRYDLVEASSSLYKGNNIQCGTGDGTNHFWTAGAGDGTFFVSPPNSPVVIQSDIPNTRYVKAINGNLYFSTQLSVPGIYMIPGLPESSGNSVVLLFATGTNSQPAAFDINPSQTLAYVADQKKGVQRWSNRAGTWGLDYTLPIKAGAFGVVADFSGVAPVVYATTGESSGNRLIAFSDAGASAVARTLATVSTNECFRGVDFVPDLSPVIVSQPSSQAVAKGSPATLTVAVSSAYPVTYQWRKNGVNIVGATDASLTIDSVTQAGKYTVVVANPYGSVASSNAIVSLLESVRPRVVIAVPRANQVVSNSVLNIRGTASDNVAVASVSYRANSDSWQQAQGTKSWTGQVTLVPGTNWVQAFATDTSGNSSVIASNKVFYVVVTNLNIAVSGGGTVSGSVTTKTNASVQYAIGRSVILTANAKPGQTFLGWSGFTNSSDSKIQFIMPDSEVDLTAQFVPSPFPSASRVYRGLILAADPFDMTNSGTFTLTMTRNGAFSGRLNFVTSATSFSGRLGLFGGQTNIATATFPTRIGGQNCQMAFQIMLGPPDLVSGSVTATGTTNVLAQIEGGLVANTNLGRFNVVVSSTGANPPPGYGYGSVAVANSGVKINLTLSDDKAVIANLAEDRLVNDTIPIFTPLYGGRGFLSGWLIVSNQQISSSPVVWRKAPGASATYYKDGFEQTLEIDGSIFKPVTNLASWGTGTIIVDGQVLSNGYVDFAHATNSKGSLIIPVSDGQNSPTTWVVAPGSGLVKLNVGGISGTGILMSAPANNLGIFGFTTEIQSGVGVVHSVRAEPGGE